jgi:hypothetical protein
VDVQSKMSCVGCGNGGDGVDKVASCDYSRIGALTDEDCFEVSSLRWIESVALQVS